MEINEAHIIVTGGSSGIGKETARQLIEKGAKVLITGRDVLKLEKVAKELGAIPLVFDISNLDSIPEKASEALKLLEGKIDVLINNAGIGYFKQLGEISVADFQSIFNTNVFGLTLFTQEVLKTFKKQDYGNIINLGSSAAVKGYVGATVYAASKFAVRGITQTWQAELRKHNIRVSLVNPSEVATAFNNMSREERDEQDNKLGPQDIAHVIISILEMRDKGFVPELNVWATNPF